MYLVIIYAGRMPRKEQKKYVFENQKTTGISLNLAFKFCEKAYEQFFLNNRASGQC